MTSHPSAIISQKESDMNRWNVGGGVCHAKKHDRGFIESSVGDESGLPLVAFLDVDVVVSPSYVKLSKDLGILEFVDEVRDQREGICVLDGVFIEVTIVLARSESAVLFLDKEEWRCLGRLRWADLSRAKVFINEVVGGLPFFYRERVEFADLWDKRFVKVNGMVIGASGGNMVCGLLGKDLGILSIFCWEGFLGFLGFGLHGKIRRHGELVDHC